MYSLIKSLLLYASALVVLTLSFLIVINLINPLKEPIDCTDTILLGGGKKEINNTIYLIKLCSYGTSSRDNSFNLRIQIKDRNEKILITRYEKMPTGVSDPYHSSSTLVNGNVAYYLVSSNTELLVNLPPSLSDVFSSKTNEIYFTLWDRF
jgi:hypothetical protein